MSRQGTGAPPAASRSAVAGLLGAAPGPVGDASSAAVDAGVDVAAAAQLTRAASTYERVLARAGEQLARGRLERAVAHGEAALIAATSHGGRLADGRVEALGLALAAVVPPRPVPRLERPVGAGRVPAGERVLHVATHLLPVGGHTRLLLNWIRNDPGADHRVVVTRQTLPLVPVDVRAQLAAAGVPVLALGDAAGHVERAARLRAAARAHADVVVLHVHQYDLDAVAALADDAAPPTVLVNHADHQFWVGSSVADVVACIRPWARALDDRRQVARSCIVPIPLALPDAGAADAAVRSAARRRLALPDDAVVLLTMGTPYKFRPTAAHDFFGTLGEVLRRHPRAHALVVGVRDDEIAYAGAERARMRGVGMQRDPAVFQRAADLFLESFPWGSLTALLESAALGTVPVPMYGPIAQLDISEDAALHGLVSAPPDRAAYLARVSALVEDVDGRAALGSEVARQIRHWHAGEGWAAARRAAVDAARSAGHAVRPIAPTAALHARPDLDRAVLDLAALAGTPADAVGGPLLDRGDDLLRLLWASVRAHETRPSSAHAACWGRQVAGRLLRRLPALHLRVASRAH